MQTKIDALVSTLRDRSLTLGFAESCTGGMISSRVTELSGVSAVFMGGIVSYSNDVKMRVLGVDRALLEAHGAVSTACAEAMARGAQQVLKADVVASVTGIAGPTGGTEHKRVGLVYVGFGVRESIDVERFDFETRGVDDVRSCVRTLAVEAVLDGLLRRVDSV